MKFDTMIVVIVSNYIGSDVFMTHPAMSHQKRIFGLKSKIFVKMTPFDPKWPKMKFDTMIAFIVSNYIYPDVFMTNRAMSHRKRIFWSKSKIWPQMTPFDLGVLRPSIRSKLMSNKQIGIKKSSKNGHVWPVNCAKISTLQVDFLEILNNSRTRNENSDSF